MDVLIEFILFLLPCCLRGMGAGGWGAGAPAFWLINHQIMRTYLTHTWPLRDPGLWAGLRLDGRLPSLPSRGTKCALCKGWTDLGL